ncbi:4048_t:CDS:2 [Funneliformis mosseae]|uniref:4048_t:CDS:1 n=1 Tax=Funneliformis mosseae TaxID=27381 RepID=A0A9N8VA06_FUNMO|nr:4048_t:CDS:2 [Funneliformis mosseae]
MSLDAILESANLLLQTTLSSNIGFKEILNNEKLIFSHKEEEILKLATRLEQIKEQRRDLHYTLQRKSCLENFTTGSDEASEIISLEVRIKEKKKTLASLNSKNQVKDKAVENTETGQVILTSLFSEGNKTSSHETCLNEMINKRDLLVSEFLKSHQELLKVQYELTNLKKAVIARHRENRTLMMQINEFISKPIEKYYENSGNNQAVTLQLKSLSNDLANARAKREIVRNILQGLILESGVDWANDEHLLNLILIIGEEI